MTAGALCLRVGELERLTAGTFHGREREVCIHGAAIDSRRVTPGCAFACFEGERVDGHDFAATAVGSGAGLVIASRPMPEVPVGVLEVPDVGAALRALAGRYREQRQDVVWIGITGSNGKTTVKEMLRAVCAAHGPTHATPGNYNNLLGVPLTILGTPVETRFAVVEMGANAQGEIDQLAGMLRPDHGLITSIGPAHLEGFGGLDGVVRGKSELFRHCRVSALASLCGCASVAAAYDMDLDSIVAVMQSQASCPLEILLDENVADEIASSEPPALRSASGPVRLAMPGLHSLRNAIAVLRMGQHLGFARETVLAAVAAVQPVAGRLRTHRIGGHRLFDDSYNANPASMEAGLQVLSREPGARLAVLGGMGELGPNSDRLHRDVGACAARLGLALIGVGAGGALIVDGYRQAGGRDSDHAGDHAQAVDMVVERLRVGPTAVLIKASRSAALDVVVQQLLSMGTGGMACSVY